MDAPNEDKYVAKYPMPEGGLIKTGGEPMSQQEWDERVEKNPTVYGAIVKYLREKREQDLKEKAESLPQQEKDEPCEEVYLAMLEFVCKKSRKLKEIQRRHEEIFKQEEDKVMMEIGRYLVKLLIEKAKETKAEEEDLGTSSDSEEDTQWSP